MQHYNILVNGLVQGVYFRTSAVAEAEKLGLKGYVRNLDDYVFVEAEGPESALDKLVKWCEQGPENARVERVSVDKTTILKGYKEFSIRR